MKEYINSLLDHDFNNYTYAYAYINSSGLNFEFQHHIMNINCVLYIIQLGIVSSGGVSSYLI